MAPYTVTLQTLRYGTLYRHTSDVAVWHPIPSHFRRGGMAPYTVTLRALIVTKIKVLSSRTLHTVYDTCW
jgi:hypothetical protein